MTDLAACETHLTEAGTLAFRVALSVLRHREDAEDVAQEAVVRSLQRFTSLRDHTRFRSWLVRVAWRLALDRRRGDTRRTVRDFRLVTPDGSQTTIEHELIQRERADRLWAAIDDLPPRLRTPLVLGTVEGHSLEEIASVLDVPVGTVKSRSFKARRELKKKLLGAGVVSAVIAAVSVITWPRLALQIEMPGIQSPVVHSRVIQSPVLESPVISSQVAASAAARTVPVVVAAKTDIVATPYVPTVSALPGMTPVATPAIEIPIVDTRVVRLPTVRVPVVEVPNIQIPAVRVVSAGSPETHPEKQR